MILLKQPLVVILTFTLVFFSCSTGANLERYVKKKVDLIVWANVKDKETGFTIELYKYTTLQSLWLESGHETLKAIILDKYGTDEFSHRVILPGVCYVYYTETDKDGYKKYFLSSGGTEAAQYEVVLDAKQGAGVVVDYGCVAK